VRTNLSRRRFLRHAAAAIPAQAFPQAPAPRPNVLFIVVDDLDCRIGAYGDPVAKTPNLDRLAARGVRFDRAYCQYPLCNPTRSSVLSGRYPTSTGVLDNNTYLLLEAGQFTMPDYFQRNGYNVALFGKIFHGQNRGFHSKDALPPNPAWFTPAQRAAQQAEQPAYWSSVHSPYRTLRLPDPSQYAWANLTGPLPDGDRGQDFRIAGDAIASLEKMAAAGKPFFLAAGFHKPHVPLTAPKEFFDLFDPARMPLPPDFDTEPRRPPGMPADEFRENIDLFASRSFSVQEAREAMRAYYACMSYMDAQAGRLLDRLRDLGLEQDTIVVLWGDHGWHLGEKGMWAKGTLFEVSARGPLIIAAPRTAPAGRTCRRVVQYLDLYPTLVSLCGLPAAPWLEGASLTPLLENPDANWDKPAFTVQAREWRLGRSVRDGRWRYTEWEEGRRGAALFDHRTDPHEMRNLASDPNYAGERERLRRLLREGPLARRP